jgi:hypothetical protein
LGDADHGLFFLVTTGKRNGHQQGDSREAQEF